MKQTHDLPFDEWLEMMKARISKLERFVARHEREKKLREESEEVTASG